MFSEPATALPIIPANGNWKQSPSQYGFNGQRKLKAQAQGFKGPRVPSRD